MQWNISLIKVSLVFIPWVPFTAASVCGGQRGLYFLCLHAFLPCAVLTRVQITNGDVSQERTLTPGKEGAQTRRLVTWGMLPSSWVCGSKHTNLCKGVSRGWGHWPEAPCSTCNWETCNARFNKWSLFFYETNNNSGCKDPWSPYKWTPVSAQKGVRKRWKNAVRGTNVTIFSHYSIKNNYYVCTW